MYKYSDIRQVHLEISSECNAACPMCARNLHGYPYNDGYEEHSMTLAQAQKIFSPEFLQQIHTVHINGNFGDIVMADQARSIIEYFRSANADLFIDISTNGAARDSEFWTGLAELGCRVQFCLDGLEHTHSRYRRRTLYSQVIKNAQTFIAAGGRAVWKMIRFDHNQHEIEQAEQLAQAMAFDEFRLVDHGRNTGPVFDRHGQLVDIFQPWGPGGDNLQEIIWLKQQPLGLEHLVDRTIKPITCEVAQTRSIYISSVGRVYPCCYLGFAPETYGHGNYFQVINEQIRQLIDNNSALDLGIEQAMAWFDQVSESWNQPRFESGRLVQCNNTCGAKCT